MREEVHGNDGEAPGKPRVSPAIDMDRLFDALARSKFRSRFTLKDKDLVYLAGKGLDEIMEHARKFLAARLFGAVIANDGRQTPMRGHPVFIAQHATGTCCRQCLAKWHRIPRGRALNHAEQEHVLDVIRTWLNRQSGSAAAGEPE